MEEIKGYVDHIVFRNQENGYTVFELNTKDGDLTCVGSFLFIEEGELLKLSGIYVDHPVYGRQLSVSFYEICTPDDLVSIERYLGSGAIKGVGAVLAGKIVNKFREDTFRIIEEEPERLAEIKGISERKAREIAEQMEGKKDLRKAMIYLQKYGISTAMAAKIYQYYGNGVYHVLEENPYRLADDITGIGFRTADEIARKIGIRVDSDYRIRCGIFYTLMQGIAAGHVFLGEDMLENKTAQLLELDLEGISTYLQDLSIEKKIIIREKDGKKIIYPTRFYYMELNVAKMLLDLDMVSDLNPADVICRLDQIESEMDLPLDEIQKNAVVEAVRHGVMVMTGGPGTGKTTTINAMIRYFEQEKATILLAAPTGRAAKRMTEATGWEAVTIHRLLEVNGNPEREEGPTGFARNRDNPLDADVIIIDEMSMVDLPLMHALLCAICPGTRLIMVGDRDQLPSVGPGNVLKDIIGSGCFSVVKLSKIFRQAGTSDIVVNAHKINRGESVSLDNRSRDFFFLKRYDANQIIRIILSLVRDKLPRYVNASSYDIQVLTPMRKGLLGAWRLNEILQEYLNPPDSSKTEMDYGDRKFRTGDKVMQIRNNYQLEWEIRTRRGMVIDKGLGIFNGDMGIIREINTGAETMMVEFDESRLVTYSFRDLDELELAFAITIHKSQGSEYPAVVIPLLSGPLQLYNRNLIYTAITRAKNCVVIAGSDAVFEQMIRNTTQHNRNSTLAERLKEF